SMLALVVASSVLTVPVASAEDAQEFWPELQFHYWFDEHRSRAIFMGTHNRDLDSGTFAQAQVGLTFEHQFAKNIWGRLGYRHGNATDGGPFYENRLLTEQTFGVPLADVATVLFRTRQDFRWLDTGFVFRVRERMQVQRDFTIAD